MNRYNIVSIIIIVLMASSLFMQFVVDKSTTAGLIKYAVSQIDTVILAMSLIIISICRKGG